MHIHVEKCLHKSTCACMCGCLWCFELGWCVCVLRVCFLPAQWKLRDTSKNTRPRRNRVRMWNDLQRHKNTGYFQSQQPGREACRHSHTVAWREWITERGGISPFSPTLRQRPLLIFVSNAPWNILHVSLVWKKKEYYLSFIVYDCLWCILYSSMDRRGQ